jgi:hypothetical protein
MLKNAAVRHYQVPINRSFRKTFVMKLKHADGSEEFYDLTGWTAKAEIRTRPPEAKLIVALRTEIDVVNHTVSLYFETADTNEVIEAQGEYDLVLTDPLGDSQTYLTGNITFVKTVTRITP